MPRQPSSVPFTGGRANVELRRRAEEHPERPTLTVSFKAARLQSRSIIDQGEIRARAPE